LMEYQASMTKYAQEFRRLVDAFLDKYDTLVAAAAFQLGTLFDRDEYPTRDQVARKFSMDTSFTPLPAAGDFRLDVESSVQRELIEQYEAKAKAQLAQANQDSWTRLHTALSKMSDRLTVDESGKTRVFHNTLVTNAEELCDLLTVMNVTNDPDLERARRRLAETLSGVTPQDLRESPGFRTETKQKVDAILDAFDWGIGGV
jgi:hypothetical protein